MFKSRTLKMAKGLTSTNNNHASKIVPDSDITSINSNNPNSMEKVLAWLEKEFKDYPNISRIDKGADDVIIDDCHKLEYLNEPNSHIFNLETIDVINYGESFAYQGQDTLSATVNTTCELNNVVLDNCNILEYQNEPYSHIFNKETTDLINNGESCAYQGQETLSATVNTTCKLNNVVLGNCNILEYQNEPYSHISNKVTTDLIHNGDPNAYSSTCEINTLEKSQNSTSTDLRKRSRWNRSCPDLWKKNKAKRLRSMCHDYTVRINKEDKTMSGKKPKPTDCSKCKFKCCEKFNSDDRLKLCQDYWKLDYNRQKDFIINFVDVNKASQRPGRLPKTKRPRTLSNNYYFEKNLTKERVCQKFFTGTLCISNGPVNTALQGKSDNGLFIKFDRRGKQNQSRVNKTSNEDIISIKTHIDSFPVVESHYTRKSNRRHYLDEKLSISKMYELFMEKYKTNYPQNTNIPSQKVYRQIFCTNYNYSFFKPKKDQCASCEKFKNSNNKDKQSLYESHNEHLERMHQSFIAKDIDNTLAKITKNYVVATFDLQSTLQIPSSEISLMFYSRKLNMFNLTVYESSPPNNAFCYTWTEVNGKRGSSEIGSCLYKWFQTLNPNITQVTLYSDTCGGQNRNQYIMALMIFIVKNTHIQKIEHKFMESGHSMMKVDSMHSAIERAKRNVPVFSVQDWITVFKTARSTRNKNKNKGPYIVQELLFQDFFNLQSLAQKWIRNRKKCSNNETLNWLKVKSFEYQQENPFVVGFKYDYFNEYQYIDVRGEIGKRRSVNNNNENLTLSKLYNRPIPISNEKKKDLLNLCKKKVIPDVYHHYYSHLPSLSTKQNAEIMIENCTDEEEI